MERAEAEAVSEQGPETVVAVLRELSAQNALLRRQVAELSERLAKQDERIAELERRLKRNLCLDKGRSAAHPDGHAALPLSWFRSSHGGESR